MPYGTARISFRQKSVVFNFDDLSLVIGPAVGANAMRHN
jgi:hypothetical protein